MYTHMYSGLNLESSSTMAVHSVSPYYIYFRFTQPIFPERHADTVVRCDVDETHWWGADN